MAPNAGNLYAPLWCKSNGSFLEGASHPEELVAECARLGLPALGLTDRDGVYGVVRAHLEAARTGVQLIIGSEVTVDDGTTIQLLAADRTGHGNLCRLITQGRRRSPKGESKVSWGEVCERADGLLALWGGEGSLIAQPDTSTGRSRLRPYSPRTACARPFTGRARNASGSRSVFADVGPQLREAFGDRLYAMVARHQSAHEIEIEAQTRARAARLGLPIVAATEVLYHSRARRPLQDVLSCIRAGVTLKTAGRIIRPNDGHALATPYAMAELFVDDRAALERTLEVAARCDFRLDEIRYRYPSENLPSGHTSMEWLRELTAAGARERYGGPPAADVSAQLERELDLIDELDYPGYFLTMYEIVRFCQERGILCQGRGSAANSAVCFCLGVTAIDPVRMNLLFERFLSRERAEPPDIDLDIEHDRREEVIQHVYTKYGREHAAMVANVVRYRPRSAVRDIGKVLGLPETALDRLAKMLPHHGEVPVECLRQAGLDPDHPTSRHLLEITNDVLDFPRHLSIHPGGFLLGHDPVCELVPIENATMEDRTVIQWDKEDVEALGLFKVDLLGLGALTQMHLAFDLLKEHRNEDLSMATIPADDPETFDAICKADTVGVFQIESRAQMAMLPRLRPRRFYDLVIEVSIVRPGPISGGMVHPYLRRRRGEEEVEYPHPSLEPVLAKTLGVPLFQEQVMKLAMVAADYTPGEADQLRRDMAAWRRTGRIEQHRTRLVSRMTAKGIALEFAERVFEQIRGFGEYGFPESHAASFALISYATSYLKVHYPAEFACSLLNAQPMGFYAPSTIVEDAKHHDVEVRPVDILQSTWDCTLEPTDFNKAAENNAGEQNVRHCVPEGGAPGKRVRSLRTARSAPLPAVADKVPARDRRPATPEARAADDATRSDLTLFEERSVVSSVARAGPSSGPNAAHPFALRMGTRYVKGLKADDWERIEAARNERPFESLDDFVRRTRASDALTARLAEAGALESLELSRREALWEGRRLARDGDRMLPQITSGELPELPPLEAFETIAWDYRTTSHSPRGHPLATVRDELRALGLPDAKELAAKPAGSRVSYAGAVICRQRPGTAKGVVFLTLEDETGFVNALIWPNVWEKHGFVVKTQPFLGLSGRLESEQGVTHLIVDKTWTPKVRRPAENRSRDFH